MVSMKKRWICIKTNGGGIKRRHAGIPRGLKKAPIVIESITITL